MKRRTFLAGTAAAALAAPAIAQTSKKLTFLSWNIVDQAEMFKRWFAAFQAEHPATTRAPEPIWRLLSPIDPGEVRYSQSCRSFRTMEKLCLPFIQA